MIADIDSSCSSEQKQEYKRHIYALVEGEDSSESIQSVPSKDLKSKLTKNFPNIFPRNKHAQKISMDESKENFENINYYDTANDDDPSIENEPVITDFGRVTLI